MPRLLASTLAVSLSVLALSSSLSAAAPPLRRKGTPPSVKTMMRVTGISPAIVAIGDKVTVTGRNLDKVVAIILGKVSPVIVDKSASQIVFVAPYDAETKNFTAKLFLVAPGQPILATNFDVTVAAKTRLPKAGVKNAVAVDEDGQISP